MIAKTAATDAFVAAYAAARGEPVADYAVSRFGEGDDMAGRLNALVLHGPKRGTTSLLRDFEIPGEPVPKAGDIVVSLGAGDVPELIWRTTRVDIVPFHAVDADFAWDEGEGDRTLADWVEGHRAWFTAQAAREGFVFDDDTLVVLERFELVWPAEFADRPPRAL